MSCNPSTPLYNSPYPDSIPPVLLDLSKRVPDRLALAGGLCHEACGVTQGRRQPGKQRDRARCAGVLGVVGGLACVRR